MLGHYKATFFLPHLPLPLQWHWWQARNGNGYFSSCPGWLDYTILTCRVPSNDLMPVKKKNSMHLESNPSLLRGKQAVYPLHQYASLTAFNFSYFSGSYELNKRWNVKIQRNPWTHNSSLVVIEIWWSVRNVGIRRNFLNSCRLNKPNEE